MQRLLILECDEQLDPDDVTLDQRRKSLQAEALENIKPPLMAGSGNAPDAIRKAFRGNLIALQLEGLPVDENTPSYVFWDYICTMEERYRSQKQSSDATEPI